MIFFRNFRPESPKARGFFLGPGRAWKNGFGPSGFRARARPEHVPNSDYSSEPGEFLKYPRRSCECAWIRKKEGIFPHLSAIRIYFTLATD